MKKVFLILGVLLFLGMLSACSSDDDITNVFKEKTSTENSENENEGKNLLEVWELRTFDKGWGMVTTFNPNEVICHFYANGIIEIINETDINLYPFVNSGSYKYQFYTKDTSKDFVSINGKEFEIQVDNDDILHLYYNSIESYWADGEKYDFVIIK